MAQHVVRGAGEWAGVDGQGRVGGAEGGCDVVQEGGALRIGGALLVGKGGSGALDRHRRVRVRVHQAEGGVPALADTGGPAYRVGRAQRGVDADDDDVRAAAGGLTRDAERGGGWGGAP